MLSQEHWSQLCSRQEPIPHISVEEERAALPEPSKEGYVPNPSCTSALLQRTGTQQQKPGRAGNRRGRNRLTASIEGHEQKEAEARNGNRVEATSGQQQADTKTGRAPVPRTADEKLSAALRVTQAEGSKITGEALSKRAGVRKQTALEWLRGQPARPSASYLQDRHMEHSNGQSV